MVSNSRIEEVSLDGEVDSSSSKFSCKMCISGHISFMWWRDRCYREFYERDKTEDSNIEGREGGLSEGM